MIVDNNWATTAVNANFRAIEDAFYPEIVKGRFYDELESLSAENPEIEKLARRLAQEFAGNPDTIVFRGMPETVSSPRGTCYHFKTEPMPLWRAFVLTARYALMVVDERVGQ